MQFFAFDIIGEMTVNNPPFPLHSIDSFGLTIPQFGKRFGYLDAGEDPEKIIPALENTLTYGARVGVYPEFHTFLFMAKHLLTRSSSGIMKVLSFGEEAVEARCKKPLSDDGNSPMDAVSKLLVAHQANPTKVTKNDVIFAGITNVSAGTDTTAISISAVIYHLWKNPRYLYRLRQELDEQERRGEISNPITYEQANAIPYLQAVIKEALRMHPAAGMPIARVVPKGGSTIAGRFFPSGVSIFRLDNNESVMLMLYQTVVGINAWAAHANREVFGADADHFNPERWLEAPEIVKPREAYYMTVCVSTFQVTGVLLLLTISSLDRDLVHVSGKTSPASK